MTRKIRNKSKAIYIGFPVITWEEFISEEGWVFMVGGFWSLPAVQLDHIFRTMFWQDREYEFYRYKGSYLKALVRYLI